MISYLSNDIFFVSLVAAVVMMELIYLCFTKKKSPDWKCEAVIRRMEAYAFLKTECQCMAPNCDEKQLCKNKFYLSTGGHEILLGTLKKIEAKSAVLTSVIVFSLSLSGSSVAASGAFDEFDRFFVVFIVALMLPLALSFRGIKQIDQADFRKLNTYEKSNEEVARILQHDLMCDLVKKERAFHFSKAVAMCSILIAFALLVWQVAASPIAEVLHCLSSRL